MAWTDKPPATRIQLLINASKAALKFNEACRRAFAPLHDGETRSAVAQLRERDLQEWRDATDALFDAVDQPDGMFLATSGFRIPGFQCKEQVNAINLALIFELFMPEAIRHQYPFLTNEVPLIDPEKVNSLYLGNSAKEKLQKLWSPVSASIGVLLHLYAHQAPNNTLKVLQGALLDACTTVLVIGKTTLEEAIDKKHDCQTYFGSAFIENVSFTTKEKAKALEVWENARRQRMDKIQSLSPSAAQRKYCWERLCLHVVRGAAGDLVQETNQRAEKEMAEAISILERNKKTARHFSELASSNDSIASSSKAKPSKSGAGAKNKAAAPKETAPRDEIRDTDASEDASKEVSEDFIQPEAIPGLSGDEEVLAGYGQEELGPDTTPEREATQFVKHVVIPKGFRFNAPQPNAVQATMTPSPPSTKPVPTWTKVKKAATNKSKETSTVQPEGTERQKKRKYTDAEEVDEEDSPHKKKRRVEDRKALESRAGPASGLNRVPIANGAAGVAPSNVQPRGNAGPPSTDLDVPLAVKKAPKRQVVMAAPSSDESEDERRRVRVKKDKPKKANNPTTVSNGADTTVPSKAGNATALTSRVVVAPVAKLAAKTGAPKDLGTRVVTMTAKARLAALRATDVRGIDDGVLNSEFEAIDDAKMTKSKPKKSRGDNDISEELDAGKSKNSKDALHRSKTQLADLQTRVKKSTRPAERRTQHLPIHVEDVDEDELDEDEEQEEQPKKKKRGRPRKETVEEAPPRPSINRYRTGNNETGRVRWSHDEDATLLFAIEALYYRGQLTRPWDAIARQHGIHGTEDQVLATRNVQQMRDRARNIVIGMIKKGEEVPEYLSFISLPAAYR